MDNYGILVWDEFFQPNPSDGPDPDDLQIYLANVRDEMLRFRNHPSIASVVCANEGDPPPEIASALLKMVPELDPCDSTSRTRLQAAAWRRMDRISGGNRRRSMSSTRRSRLKPAAYRCRPLSQFTP